MPSLPLLTAFGSSRHPPLCCSQLSSPNFPMPTALGSPRHPLFCCSPSSSFFLFFIFIFVLRFFVFLTPSVWAGLPMPSNPLLTAFGSLRCSRLAKPWLPPPTASSSSRHLSTSSAALGSPRRFSCRLLREGTHLLEPSDSGHSIHYLAHLSSIFSEPGRADPLLHESEEYRCNATYCSVYDRAPLYELCDHPVPVANVLATGIIMPF
jgi:hypothetical protein